MTLTIRAAQPSDAKPCGRIMFEAFQGIAHSHGFKPDFTSPEEATGLAHLLIADPETTGVVAESEGAIVGSNFLAESDMIRGVGPITVARNHQGNGIGRRLMEEVLRRADGSAGVRLLQDSFNMRSLALYSSLGFKAREPMLVMAGRPKGDVPAEFTVRPMQASDVSACDALCQKVHGISRRNETSRALTGHAPLVAIRNGAVTAYMTAPRLWLSNHAVAATDDDMRALILGAAARFGELSFLLPVRQSALLNWCLEQGMRAMKPMTLMSKGTYRDAAGTYMPSVFY